MRNFQLFFLILVFVNHCDSIEKAKPIPVRQNTPSTRNTLESEDTLRTRGLKMEYFDLKTLPPSNSVSFYEFQEKNHTGLGVLKQGYSFNLVSWMRTEDFGIRCTLITSKAPEKSLNTVSEADYVNFINTELKKIVPALFKDKNMVNALLDALKKPDHYTYYPDSKSYSVQADHPDYDEISILAERILYKDLCIVIVARGIDTSW